MSEVQTIEVNGKIWEVPNYVEPNKLGEFEAYCRIRDEWDKLEKTYDLGEGVIVTFPRVLKKHKLLVLTKPKEVQEDFIRRRAIVQDHLTKLMLSKAKVFKKSNQEVKAELDDKTTEILDLLGRDYSVAEVHKIFRDRHINIPYPTLLRFAKRNEEKIRELRNTWREDIQDVSITIKRSRLEKLNYLLNDLLQNYEGATPLNKIQYSKEIRGVLEQARKEVEGEEIKLTITGRIDIEATISSYLNEAQILRDLTIQQLVISRIAARLNLPAMSIIERLAHSFYSQFNGFRPNSDLATKILYPSSTNYDILDLEKKNLQLEQVEPPKVSISHIINPQNKIRVDTSREKLKKRLDEMVRRSGEVRD